MLIVGQPKAWDGHLKVYTRGEITGLQYDLTKHADRLAEPIGSEDGLIAADAESRNLAGTPHATLAPIPCGNRWAFLPGVVRTAQRATA